MSQVSVVVQEIVEVCERIVARQEGLVREAREIVAMVERDAPLCTAEDRARLEDAMRKIRRVFGLERSS